MMYFLRKNKKNKQCNLVFRQYKTPEVCILYWHFQQYKTHVGPHFSNLNRGKLQPYLVFAFTTKYNLSRTLS